MRRILKGKLTTSEPIEAHEATLPPNAFPHPPHHYVHSEMWLMREGTVGLTIHGVSHRLSPGGLGLVRSNEETRQQARWPRSSYLFRWRHRDGGDA